jgi:hypothetical protein
VSEVPEPTVWDSAYVVSCLPENDQHFCGSFEVRVERRSPNGWAVLFRGDCIDIDGKRSNEPLPSSREDEWIARHRFDLPTAMEVAKKFAPTIRVNRYTVEMALEIYKEETA